MKTDTSPSLLMTSVIVILLQDGESIRSGAVTMHGPVVDYFRSWCNNCFLQPNVSKTKDMAIDFRRQPRNPSPTVVMGSDIELVTTYKYLGTVLDNKLKFEENTDAICKKGQQQLFFLRKMN
ncbi:unnamed protein product [Coregonus sp. 'balchen']|nr:unnamed protein product [Coregonus sp. 'balchen']